MDRHVTTPSRYQSLLQRLQPFLPKRLRQWIVLSVLIHLIIFAGIIYKRHQPTHGLSTAVMISLGAADSPSPPASPSTRQQQSTPHRPRTTELPPAQQPVLPSPSPSNIPTVSTTTGAPIKSSTHQPLAGAAATAGHASPSKGAAPSLSGNSRSGSGTTTIEGVFGQGDGPRFTRRVLPDYPAQAFRRQREGVVLLRLTITDQGTLRSVELVKDPGFGFADAAIQAVKQSHFSPGTHNGKPVTMRTLLPIRFVLEDH